MNRANPEYYYKLGLYETYLMICAKEYSNRIGNKEAWFHRAVYPWYHRLQRLTRLTSE